jgi:transposase
MKIQTTQPFLFDSPLCEPPPVLQVTENKIDKFVFVKNTLLYQFPKTDKLQLRQIMVQLYLNHNFSQGAIATAFSYRRETINDFVKRYRARGLSGLEDKIKKRTVLTPEIVAQVAVLTKEKVRANEIARQLNIHRNNVSTARQMIRDAASPALPLVLEKDEKESLDKQAMKAMACSEDTELEILELDSEESLNLEDVNLNSETEPSKQKAIDPLDRREDRMLASIGLLNDAKPIFAEHSHVENAGSLLAVAMLTQDCFLPSIEQTYRSFGASFYGLRNTFMCFFMMAVLRIKNINSIEESHGLKVGRLLGLDRSPCSKTLRRKFSYLTSRKQAKNTMNIIAQQRITKFSAETQSPDKITLYLDGHIHKYNGKDKFSKTFSTSKNRVVKGATDYYLNLPDGTPLLIIPCDFNQSMFEMMRSIITQAKKMCSGRRLTIVFDRGGSSAKTYETILNLDCDFIAYHKNPTAIDLNLFELGQCEINGQSHSRKPYDHEIQLEVKIRKGATYHKTGRFVKVREIVVLRDDNKQTPILTSRRDIDAEVIATEIFQRWTQENYFKYGLEHYSIDALCTYKTLELDSDVDKPNPEWKAATKKIDSIRKKMTQLMKRPNEKLIAKEFQVSTIQLSDFYNKKQQQKLMDLAGALQKEEEFRKTISKRIEAKDFRKFNDEARLVSNLIKMTAYNIEGDLADLFHEVSKCKNGNERGLIHHFTKTTGSIRIEGKRLLICLEQQSARAKTLELNSLCQEVNKFEAIYPGSDLIMEFSVQGC